MHRSTSGAGAGRRVLGVWDAAVLSILVGGTLGPGQSLQHPV